MISRLTFTGATAWHINPVTRQREVYAKFTLYDGRVVEMHELSLANCRAALEVKHVRQTARAREYLRAIEAIEKKTLRMEQRRANDSAWGLR